LGQVVAFLIGRGLARRLILTVLERLADWVFAAAAGTSEPMEQLPVWRHGPG
jgi:hypothetical protein